MVSTSVQFSAVMRQIPYNKPFQIMSLLHGARALHRFLWLYTWRAPVADNLYLHA